jgi:hypothetical protein
MIDCENHDFNKLLEDKLDKLLQHIALIEQYKKCCEDWDHFDTLLWQIPFSTVVATTGLLTLGYAYIEEIFIRKILLLILIIFVLGMMLVAVKVKFLQVVRSEFAREIEEKLKINVMLMNTSECLEYFSKRGKPKTRLASVIYSIKAFHAQISLYFGLIASLLYLLSLICTPIEILLYLSFIIFFIILLILSSSYYKIVLMIKNLKRVTFKSHC